MDRSTALAGAPRGEPPAAGARVYAASGRRTHTAALSASQAGRTMRVPQRPASTLRAASASLRVAGLPPSASRCVQRRLSAGA